MNDYSKKLKITQALPTNHYQSRHIAPQPVGIKLITMESTHISAGVIKYNQGQLRYITKPRQPGITRLWNYKRSNESNIAVHVAYTLYVSIRYAKYSACNVCVESA